MSSPRDTSKYADTIELLAAIPPSPVKHIKSLRLLKSRSAWKDLQLAEPLL